MPPTSTPPPAGPEPPARRSSILARQFALAIELPFVFVAMIVIGGAIGYWLDRRLHTSPLFLLLLGGLGFAAGVRELLRRLSRSGSGHGP
jgi:ATP synthase protein I